MVVRCETKGEAGRMAWIDWFTAEYRQCKGRESLDSELERTVSDSGIRLLATMQSYRL